MMEDPSEIPAPKNYAVGYRRPPESTRFKPGSSGNPKGRPKKPKTVGAIIEEALARRVTIEENGRQKKISAEEVIIRRLTGSAAKGDLKAAQLLFQLRERHRDSSAERIDPQDLEADREILEAYLSQRAGAQSTAAPDLPSGARDLEGDQVSSPAPCPNSGRDGI
jgi:hypothetical protein